MCHGASSGRLVCIRHGRGTPHPILWTRHLSLAHGRPFPSLEPSPHSSRSLPSCWVYFKVAPFRAYCSLLLGGGGGSILPEGTVTFLKAETRSHRAVTWSVQWVRGTVIEKVDFYRLSMFVPTRPRVGPVPLSLLPLQAG